MPDYVSSEEFVGRIEEQDTVRNFILSENNSRLLCIHSDGEGGFGKTQLLLRIGQAYREQKQNVIVGKCLIDFYHLNMHRKIGVLEALSKQLGLTETLKRIAEYRLSSDEVDEVEQIFKKFSKAFKNTVSKNREKIFVFFFDSYEHIQRSSHKSVNPTPTLHSSWLETRLIPELVKELNVRVVLAGRYLPCQLETLFSELEIKPFSKETSVIFLTVTLDKQGGITSEEIGELHRLTQGYPIRLSLAIDWLRHSSQNVASLLAGAKPGKSFEEKLINYIRYQLDNKKNESQLFAISSYIAIAYQRLNADILQHLTGEKKEDCEKYIDQMKTWSFIKPKGADGIILHDVMHSLFDKYIKGEDPGFYREHQELLIEYYKKILFGEEQPLSEAEQEKYILEMIDYGFQIDFDQGVERFCTIFDQVMEDGQYDFASNFLLTAAEDLKFRHQGQSKSLSFLKIDARRIEYEIETTSDPTQGLKRAEEIIDTYKDDVSWKEKDVNGLILLKKGTALFYTGRFLEAIKTFEQAKPILLKNDEGINAHWATSWTGYTYYQLGDFGLAERELKRSRKLFYKGAVYILFKAQTWNEDIKNEYRRVLQGYQISLVNLALVYFSTGRLYEAVRHARIFLHINQNLQRNDREIARAQTALALTSWSVGHRLEAKLYLDDALKRATGDPLLIGRIKTEQLRQDIHNSDFLYSSFLEFYCAKNFRERLKEFQKRIDKNEESQLPNEKVFQDIIKDLKKLGTTKEFLTAYLVQAKLYLLNIEEHSFSTVENSLKKCLQNHTKASDIQAYEKMQALENIIRLCYFARAWDTADAKNISKQLGRYSEKLEREFEKLGDSTEEGYKVFPEISARYHTILGNIAFDNALAQLDLNLLRQAIQKYLTAAELLKNFESFCEYPFYILRHRLITFTKGAAEQFEQSILTKEEYVALKEGYDHICPAIRDKFDTVFDSSLICLPSTTIEEIKQTATNFYKRKESSLPKKIILARSLTDALDIFSKQNISSEKKVELLTLRIMWLMQKARFYRRLRTGDINFALTAYNKADISLKDLIKEVDKCSGEAISLRGRLAIGRGTVHYRQGAYEDFLEFYLKDELKLANDLFKRYFEEESEKAEKLLLEGKNLLKEAQKKLDDKKSKNVRIGELKLSNLNARWLGAAYFRLGELKWLNGDNSASLNYFKKAITICQKTKYISRQLDAMESYITVCYFKKEDEEELTSNTQLKEYIQEIEKNKEKYPIILGKLRITQGDDFFTRLFRRDEEKTKEKGVYQDVRYCLKEKYRKEVQVDNLPEDVNKSLRTMMTYYIEACSLMKRAQNKRNFVIAVRVIIRRFRMLSDALVLEKAHSILDEMWDQYPNLQESEEELKTVSTFARILEGLIKEPSDNPA